MTKTVLELLEKSLEILERDRSEAMLYGEYLERLLKSVGEKDLVHVRQFENRAARIEGRIHTFTKRLFKVLDDLGEEINIAGMKGKVYAFEAILIKEDSRSILGVAKGIIPEMTKADVINWEELKEEVQKVYDDAITPLIRLFDEIKEELSQIQSVKQGIGQQLAA